MTLRFAFTPEAYQALDILDIILLEADSKEYAEHLIWSRFCGILQKGYLFRFEEQPLEWRYYTDWSVFYIDITPEFQAAITPEITECLELIAPMDVIQYRLQMIAQKHALDFLQRDICPIQLLCEPWS